MYRPVNLYCLYTCVIGSQKIKKTSSVVGYHIEMPANARLRSSGFVAGESFFLFQFVAGAPTNACLAHLWITMGLLGRLVQIHSGRGGHKTDVLSPCIIPQLQNAVGHGRDGCNPMEIQIYAISFRLWHRGIRIVRSWP